jgi:mRNA interferase MazF
MNQGEIWLVHLDPTVGAEMSKTRPALIINDNRVGKLPLKIIIPITGWKEHYSIAPWMIKIEPNEENGLDKISSLFLIFFANSHPSTCGSSLSPHAVDVEFQYS